MPSVSIHIRDYEPAELNALIDLFRGTVRRVATRDYSGAQIMAWAPDEIDREAWAARPAAKATFVAEIGGAVAGFADWEPDGHIDMLYVHAKHQRRGVASALLAHIETVAQMQGCVRLYSEVSITARPFFEARGFVVIAPQTVMARGVEFLNYRMEKRLQPV